MTTTSLLTDVTLEPRSLDALSDLFSNGSYERFEAALTDVASRLGGRTVWNINSTAEGGGVAEMLQALLPYLQDARWNVRWVVMSGDEDFFGLTKGLHNALHGVPPTGDMWSNFDKVYRSVTDRNAAEMLELVRPGDVAIVHDPQAAGLVSALTDADVHVSWQCDVGADVANECTRKAWDALLPYVTPADRYVFSREAYLWEGLDAGRLRVIPPAIDAFSTKNEPMTDEQVEALLVAAEILEGSGALAADDRRASRTGGPRPIPRDAKIVLQVSRWDRLKDPVGFIRMFAEHLGDIEDLHAVYAGPSVDGVDDDPEGAEVYAACEEVWRSLEPPMRDRLHLLSVPMDDVDENARIVNALQRRADVIVQKSLQEGFGLTVAEAMWKGRPVVGSRIGGIQDQIEDGTSGRVVDDPYDIGAFAEAVRELVGDASLATRLGDAAQQRVRAHYLAPRLLEQYGGLVGELIERG